MNEVRRAPPSVERLAKLNPHKASEAWLEYLGYRPETVENWRGKTRRDLFGFLDLLGVHLETGQLLGIQATSRDNVTARRNKIYLSDWYALVKRSPIEVRVWGWEKGVLTEVKMR